MLPYFPLLGLLLVSVLRGSDTAQGLRGLVVVLQFYSLKRLGNCFDALLTRHCFLFLEEGYQLTVWDARHCEYVAECAFVSVAQQFIYALFHLKSPVLKEWRRRQESNLRHLLRCGRVQNGWHKPLAHVSPLLLAYKV